jgi:hypothetical protein
MPAWTHLVRFIAVEDSQEHLGQLVDTTRDVGRDSVDGKDITVYLIDGTIFDGKVTKEILHVKHVCIRILWTWKEIRQKLITSIFSISSCSLQSLRTIVATFDASV